MSVPAAVRSVLAFAAVAAIGVSTFLPALHALPGMEHGGCGCGSHATPDASLAAVTITCGHAHHDGACQVAAKRCCETSTLESKDRLHGLNRASGEQGDCLLCALFASFLLTTPEPGFVAPSIDVVASLETPWAFRVEVSSRAVACRGPPIAV